MIAQQAVVGVGREWGRVVVEASLPRGPREISVPLYSPEGSFEALKGQEQPSLLAKGGLFREMEKLMSMVPFLKRGWGSRIV